VVAGEMPFVDSHILSAARALVEVTGADVGIPRTEDGYEPFHAVYRRRTCLAAIAAALEEGERKLSSWFPAVHVAILPPEIIARHDPDHLAFWNLNTPQELVQAEALARAGDISQQEP